MSTGWILGISAIIIYFSILFGLLVWGFCKHYQSKGWLDGYMEARKFYSLPLSGYVAQIDGYKATLDSNWKGETDASIRCTCAKCTGGIDIESFYKE